MIALPVDDESISDASARAQSGFICGFARVSLRASMRVLVRPIGLDMVEVGGSIKCDYRSIWHRAPQACSPQGQNRLKPVLGNPPGPTK